MRRIGKKRRIPRRASVYTHPTEQQVINTYTHARTSARAHAYLPRYLPNQDQLAIEEVQPGRYDTIRTAHTRHYCIHLSSRLLSTFRTPGFRLSLCLYIVPSTDLIPNCPIFVGPGHGSTDTKRPAPSTELSLISWDGVVTALERQQQGEPRQPI